MSDEKMRAEFEVAAEEHFWLQDLRGDYDKDEQEYLDEIVQTAWEFWKLSREALVIELPRLPNLNDFNDIGQCAASRNMHYACRRAIEAAGVRVKP